MPLTSVLVLSSDPGIAALLFAMLESEGCDAHFARDDESPFEALDRVAPRVVIVDCDSAQCTDRFIERAERRGARVVLFSPSRDHREMQRIARDANRPWFTMPIGRAELARALAGLTA